MRDSKYTSEPMDKVDVIVIGAGVVGLAVARELALRGRDVIILEASDAFGTGISSRNSEVIHAGIYYDEGSLKGRLCIQGRDLLYEFCLRHGVPHRRCGKLIVATAPEQLAQLEVLIVKAGRNGVQLRQLDRAALAAAEPELHGVAALHSPDTGILDVHGYMLALLGEAQNHGADIVYRSRVTRMQTDEGRIAVAVNGDEPELLAGVVVNCAGLYAPEVARAIDGIPEQRVPRAWFAKGNYFQLEGRVPFRQLVYPIPEPGGLGVHLTLDLAGRARFGPDVEWVERADDYSVDPGRAAGFEAAIRRYWPGLPAGRLAPAYAGIRPKISGPGEPAADFRIDLPASGAPPIINLFGIESPGVTASLAIARQVAVFLAG